MNGKYYNNPTFLEAGEEKIKEPIENENPKKKCKVFVSFPSETWKDKIFEGIIKDSNNDLIKVLTDDNRMIIVPCDFINYIEYYTK